MVLDVVERDDGRHLCAERGDAGAEPLERLGSAESPRLFGRSGETPPATEPDLKEPVGWASRRSDDVRLEEERVHPAAPGPDVTIEPGSPSREELDRDMMKALREVAQADQEIAKREIAKAQANQMAPTKACETVGASASALPPAEESMMAYRLIEALDDACIQKPDSDRLLRRDL